MSQGTAVRDRGITPAPAGLALVQDLLNTRQIGSYQPDLLTARDTAAAWLKERLPRTHHEGPWPVEVSERELTELRELRSRVRDLVTDDVPGVVADAGSAPVGSASLMLTPSGAVELVPAGRDLARIADAVWTEIFLAQQTGTWARLKICRSEPCGSAFYDRSKNNSGVWHDVRTCGNRENLRASRARRRAGENPAG